MRLRAGTGCRQESVTDLDALDRLDAHQGAGESGIQATVPVHVGSEPRDQAVREDLDDAAERLAVLVGGVDLLDHRVRGRLVEAAQRVGVEGFDVPRQRTFGVFGGRDRSDGGGVADHPDPESGQNLRGNHAEGNACGGLPGAGPFQNGPGFGETVLLHPGEVCVAGAGASQWCVSGPALDQ